MLNKLDKIVKNITNNETSDKQPKRLSFLDERLEELKDIEF